MNLVLFSPDGVLLASVCHFTIAVWAVADHRMITTTDTRGRVSHDRLELDIFYNSFHAIESLQTGNSSSLGATKQWIASNGNRLLWLPIDYRSRSLAVNDNCVVLVLETGYISLISLDSTETFLDFRIR